jgi:hypothetical protein
MRLWSIHPVYLDQKGLVALWREALLARSVLEEKTTGYKNHPQLLRFKNSCDPLKFINLYIKSIYLESLKRGYKFDKSKVCDYELDRKLAVTYGQVEYEFNHLKNKLKNRSPSNFFELERIDPLDLKVNEIFYVIPGPVENWEKRSL